MDDVIFLVRDLNFVHELFILLIKYFDGRLIVFDNI